LLALMRQPFNNSKTSSTDFEGRQRSVLIRCECSLATHKREQARTPHSLNDSINNKNILVRMSMIVIVRMAALFRWLENALHSVIMNMLTLKHLLNRKVILHQHTLITKGGLEM